MSSIRRLTELSALVSSPLPPEEALKQGLPLLRDALGASQVHLAYGWEDGFRSLGTDTNLKLSNIALWLAQRDLAARGRPSAFDLRDGRVVDFRDASSRRPCQFVAALLPVQISSDMLIACGPWPNGLKMSQVSLMQVCLPALGLLVERWLESVRAERQRNQLSALANIPRVLSESDNLDTVLTSITRTLATVSAVNYVSIDILGEDGRISLRAVNGPDRPGTASLTERWKQGAKRSDPVRDQVIRTRRPMLFPDAQNDERIPESGRNFFVRTLIRSTAVFPLLTKDEVLGVLSIASHRSLDFPVQEVELLEGLAAQLAAAVKGIQLYGELAESRQELQRLNEQLRMSMGIEHHLARTDPLTGIPNRRLIDETVVAECTRARRYRQDLSVVIADLDQLKTINDTYGHGAGDKAIRFAAGIARGSCRQMDMVGRYGGDEFVFVLPYAQLEDAAALAERFRQRLAETPAPIHDGDPTYLTVSLGVAQWDGETMEEAASLIRQADRVMYEAKTAGGNRTMLAVGDGARAA